MRWSTWDHSPHCVLSNAQRNAPGPAPSLSSRWSIQTDPAWLRSTWPEDRGVSCARTLAMWISTVISPRRGAGTETRHDSLGPGDAARRRSQSRKHGRFTTLSEPTGLASWCLCMPSATSSSLRVPIAGGVLSITTHTGASRRQWLATTGSPSNSWLERFQVFAPTEPRSTTPTRSVFWRSSLRLALVPGLEHRAPGGRPIAGTRHREPFSTKTLHVRRPPWKLYGTLHNAELGVRAILVYSLLGDACPMNP